MQEKYRILHLEDVQTDAFLVARELRQHNISFEHKVIDTVEEYIDALDNFCPDVILCDHSLPAFNSIKALEILQERKRKLPFILITAHLDEKLATQVVKMGADDYVLKDRLKRLPFAVMNAIEKVKFEEDRKQLIDDVIAREIRSGELLQEYSDKLKAATEVAGLGIWEANVVENTLVADDTILSLYEVARHEFDGSMSFFDKYLHPDDVEHYNNTVAAGWLQDNYKLEIRVLLRSNRLRYLKAAIRNQRDANGQVVKIIGTTLDVTEERLKESALRESEEKYRSFFENSIDGILLSIPNGNVIAANPAAQAIFRMTEEELKQCKRGDLIVVDDKRAKAFVDERNKRGKAKAEIQMKRKGGVQFDAEVSSSIFCDGIGNKRGSLIIRDISERILVQQMMLQSSAALVNALGELQKIMDASLDIICSIDIDGCFASLSNACRDIWQYEPAELKGRHFIERVHPDDVEKTREVIAQIKTGKPVTMFQNRYIRKDGKTVPMLWSARWDEADRRIYCIAKDATEKVRLEKAWQYERQRFEEMFFQAPSSIGALKGKDHRYVLANDNYLKLIGKSNIIGKTVKEVMPEVEAQGFLKLLDDVFETGNAFSANEMPVLLDVDGSGNLTTLYLNFIYQAYRDQDGNVEGIFFFANDVTEQVMARRKIALEKANLQSILNSTDVSYVLVDRNLKIIAFNKKANDNMLKAYNMPLVAGNLFYGLVSNSSEHAFKQNIQAVFDGQHVDREICLVTADNGKVWFRYKMNPIFSGENINGICIAAEDITTEKEAAIEKENITRDLIQRNSDLENFNYIVSHNLRAPVTNISGILWVLNQQQLSTDNKELLWSSLNESVSRLDDVIKDLNTILEAGHKKSNIKEKIDFDRLTKDIIKSIAGMVTEAKVNIDTDFSGATSIFSVKSYVHSIFINLIVNSIKYRRKNVKPYIHIKSYSNGNGLTLVFSDNGLGFDAVAKKDQVFKLYKRFHAEYEGKGMGLFMVKTHVDALGGSIMVESLPGSGTTFTIKL